MWCVSRFEASHESKVNGWGKIQDTTSHGLMLFAVSSLIAPPDKIAMLSISRSAALGGCQVALGPLPRIWRACRKLTGFGFLTSNYQRETEENIIKHLQPMIFIWFLGPLKNCGSCLAVCVLGRFHPMRGHSKLSGGSSHFLHLGSATRWWEAPGTYSMSLRLGIMGKGLKSVWTLKHHLHHPLFYLWGAWSQRPFFVEELPTVKKSSLGSSPVKDRSGNVRELQRTRPAVAGFGEHIWSYLNIHQIGRTSQLHQKCSILVFSEPMLIGWTTAMIWHTSFVFQRSTRYCTIHVCTCLN